MLKNTIYYGLCISIILTVFSCSPKKDKAMDFTGAKDEVKLMILDPGHFHAALVQKDMYDQISPVVHIYAPDGPDVQDYLKRIDSYNSRQVNPTHWDLKLYTGSDFLEKMLTDKPGNVMVMAGNNEKKTEYIKKSVDAGINVLADKPMCIDKNGFELLKQAFESARENHVLLYDIMTERYEITTILQRELSQMPSVFGELEKGTPDNPAVTKESVHHFFKYVSGTPIQRPTWYFDTNQQGEGIVDVNTHLVDLIQWECFPEQALNYETDIEVLQASHWPTLVSRAQFEKVTREPDFPNFLKPNVNDKGELEVYCNGEIIYKVKGVHAKASVIWNYQAPEGAGDTHYSIMRGTKADVIIKQGVDENYRPELYIKAKSADDEFVTALNAAITTLGEKYPGIGLEKQKNRWKITIPDSFRNGHEAHFAQVTSRYLQYLVDGKLPDWEVPNMIAKYYTTTTALEMARK